MSAVSETFRLLQPGLMSTDELKDLISQRGIKFKSNNDSDKHQWVELYEQQLLPLSQRKFPSSYQGKIINKKIAEEERKQGKTEPKPRNEFQYGFNNKSSSSPSKHHSSKQSPSSSSNSDRLKPPIDSKSLPSKKICLSRRPSSDKELDKIVINNRPRRQSECSSDGSGRESSRHSEKRDADKRSPVKSHSPTHKETDKGEPNPKRKRIAWP